MLPAKNRYTMNKCITVLILVLLSSCCKEGVEVNRYLLTEIEKECIPYQNNETIRFIHSNGYQFDFTVSNRHTRMERTEAHHCGENYSTYESLKVGLFSNTPELYVDLEMVSNAHNPFMTISINSYHFYLNISSAPDFDTLTINEKLYNNIYLGEFFNADSLTILPKEILYNKEYGIIQIEMTNEEKFTIND